MRAREELGREREDIMRVVCTDRGDGKGDMVIGKEA